MKSNQKYLSDAVNAQMMFLKKILEAKDAQGNIWQKRILPNGEYQYSPEFNPNDIEMHRSKIIQITSQLWGIPLVQEIKSKL